VSALAKFVFTFCEYILELFVSSFLALKVLFLFLNCSFLLQKSRWQYYSKIDFCSPDGIIVIEYVFVAKVALL